MAIDSVVARPCGEAHQRVVGFHLAHAVDDDALAAAFHLQADVKCRIMVVDGQRPQRSRIEIICLGSRPAVGSSRMRTSGLWMMACASPTRAGGSHQSTAMSFLLTSTSEQRLTTSSTFLPISREEIPLSGR